MNKEIRTFQTLGEAFLFRCQESPDTVGFRYKQNGEWVDVTFKEQFEYIRRLSVGLRKFGCEPGMRIAVIANTSILWGRIEMAAMGFGGQVIPIYPTNTPDDCEYIMNFSEVDYLFTDSVQGLNKVLDIWPNCPTLKGVITEFSLADAKIPAGKKATSISEIYNNGINDESGLEAQFEEFLRKQKPEDIYTVCYTSGTTGRPKGVMLAQSSMMSALNDTALRMDGMAWAGDSLLSFLPMSHILGRFESYTPYALGFVQNFAENLDSIVANLQEVRPTLFISVPRIFEKAYTKITATILSESKAKQAVFEWAVATGKKYIREKYFDKKFSLKTKLEYALAQKLVFNKIKARFGGRLRICLSGGAPLPDRIWEFMEMVGVPIFQGYGLTETCAPICFNTPTENKPGTVGKLLSDVLVKIADDGEILIKSEKNFKGYYKNEEATAESLKDGWFYTGDIGHLDEEGYLKITDRKKDLIKTAAGKFVAPQKIENLAKTSPVLNQVVVYGDEKPYITALVTLHQEAIIQFSKEKKILSSEFSELLKHPEIEKLVQKSVDDLNSELPRWETIKRYHVVPKEFTVEAGELTPSLKVKRKLLTKKYKDTLDNLYL